MCLAISTLPVLGLVPFDFERLSLVADHYLYLAMIGPALIVAFALSKIRLRPTVMALCTLLLVALAVRTYFQTIYWTNSDTLFRHELAVNSDSDVAYNNLAVLALNEGGTPAAVTEAEQLGRRSIAIEPNQPDAYVTLGMALSRQNRKDESLAAYQKAIDLSGQNPMALSNLIAALSWPRKRDISIEHFP